LNLRVEGQYKPGLVISKRKSGVRPSLEVLNYWTVIAILETLLVLSIQVAAAAEPEPVKRQEIRCEYTFMPNLGAWSSSCSGGIVVGTSKGDRDNPPRVAIPGYHCSTTVYPLSGVANTICR
jgi:hypothetical protein